MGKRDHKGNKKNSEGRFIALQYHMLNSPAGRSLRPTELAVLIRVMSRYNGSNNGSLALSSRDAAEEANVNKSTAAKALNSLMEKGFLKIGTPSSFGTNGRRATEYVVTCWPVGKSKAASREYERWRPKTKKKSSYGNRDTCVRKEGRKPDLRLVS